MKRVVFYFLGLMMVLLFACGDAGSDKTEAAANTADSIHAAEEARTNRSFLNDYNAIEAVFGNENWMLVDNKDTSFYYFSRLSDFNFKTYAYKIIKGDSSKVAHGKIAAEKNKLVWNFDGKKLFITSATTARITATVDGTDTSAKYEFTRLNSNNIAVVFPNAKKTEMKKTIPFSLFLVRSRYDYSNGTHYAFDTAQYTKKH